MAYSIQHIQQIVLGKMLNTEVQEVTIERLLFDSRHLVFPANTLFFAFKSNRRDGHSFIKELYRKGVRNFIVTATSQVDNLPDSNIILVNDSIKALQRLTVYHRKQFDYPTIGITGSNGKTIVKEWLFQLLQEDFSIVRSPSSYNSQIGVPLSIWQMASNHTLGIFEAGISQRDEMEKLASIINAQIGIFTNIGAAHSEGFSSKKEKLEEKLKLFENTATLIYCRDHSLIDERLQLFSNKRLFTWSYHKEADLKVIATHKESSQTQLSLSFQNSLFSITLPFVDKASIENALHCCALMLYLGQSFDQIKERLRLLEPISMRLELKEGLNNCTIINDSYSNDLTSLELALNFTTKRANKRKIILILSDILQSGLAAPILYQKVAALILAKNIHKLIAIGNEIKIIEEYLPNTFNVRFFDTTRTFLRQFSSKEFYQNIILLKGARLFQFERIGHRFEEKVHKAILEVDLSAIVHNLKVYGEYLHANTQLIAMVKASAYGSGSVEVAKILEFYQVDYLAVAYTDEGIELRKAGIQLPILVLNPEIDSFDSLLRYRLEPEIYSIQLLKQLIAFLPSSKTISIHLKLDTGMHRLGFEEEQLPPLLDKLKQHQNIKVKSIFSHLAASDSSFHDDFTKSQVSRFLTMYEKIAKSLSYSPKRHILNSSGILRFSQYQFEMVRLGIGLYGIDSSDLVQDRLKVVNQLKASISQIKEVKATETIGYNRSGKIGQNKRIATINIGYADGLLRKAGNGNYAVTVQGQKAPIIGNVCMDMCMIDISHIPQVKIGDEVIIFGDDPSVVDLANCLDTIPYEVLTSISNRVKRIYFRDS